ncbi:hypothetical protein VF21_02812 [Pseudogymnoascus sp. 05NY08]|nr:hypothetical protein VF21_02812 [Pseudogymnoascus sp. 05NY08]
MKLLFSTVFVFLGLTMAVAVPEPAAGNLKPPVGLAAPTVPRILYAAQMLALVPIDQLADTVPRQI